MLFKIYAESLTRFIRDYHSDMLGSDGWGDGDSTNMSTNDFYYCAEHIWGLDVLKNRGLEYFVAYNTRSGYFLFDIINIERLRRIGLSGFGEIIDE